ncbi:MAG: cytochrome b N-terminal domain-containing protein [Deltaproteobacteria bacterium]|nr:cytochrome b N-terminal domain-containing protein [Deltaproteobacteria bacterium]
MSKVLDWVNKRFPLSEFIEKHVTKYPTPKNLNYWWNFGSLAGAFFVVQFLTGVWLAMYYKPDVNLAFDSVQHIMRDVHWGWLLRYLHAIGPTGIFFAIYVHMGRALYYGSYKGPRELLWWLGLLLFVSFMAESFMGYLLPWGAMSYWGATVITNLFTAIPVIGSDLTIWLRGDFAIGDATLTRFFSLHTTFMPLAVIGVLLVFHLAALHKVGSNNPDGIELDKKGPDVIPFSPYFITKDLWFISLIFTIFFYFVFFKPDFFLEPINNEPASSLKTPLHIVPEWYFLPFYAILRSIPFKIGGVIAMAGSILILFILPYLDRSEVRSARYRPIKRVLTYIFYLNFIMLGYVGIKAPDAMSPIGLRMSTIGFAGAAYYFLYFLTMPFISRVEPVKKVRFHPEEG